MTRKPRYRPVTEGRWMTGRRITSRKRPGRKPNVPPVVVGRLIRGTLITACRSDQMDQYPPLERRLALLLSPLISLSDTPLADTPSSGRVARRAIQKVISEQQSSLRQNSDTQCTVHVYARAHSSILIENCSPSPLQCSLDKGGR